MFKNKKSCRLQNSKCLQQKNSGMWRLLGWSLAVTIMRLPCIVRHRLLLRWLLQALTNTVAPADMRNAYIWSAGSQRRASPAARSPPGTFGATVATRGDGRPALHAAMLSSVHVP